jgi:hypothetical protein
MSTAGFTKFDPRAGQKERSAQGAPPSVDEGLTSGRATLATLATLAGSRPTNDNGVTTGAWTEVEEERAAIIEYDGGVPRTWAEAFARLDPAGPPGDVPPKRWVQFIDDCGRFLDSGWASRLEALGWGPLDLFGCDRERPFARIDRAGLLWLINGGKLVALTAETATIETPTGHRQTCQRKPVEIGSVVLAWDLNP